MVRRTTQASTSREAGEGGRFLRWILRGSGNAGHHGEHRGGPNFRCELARGQPSSKLKTATPRFPPPMGLGDFVRVCVCYWGAGPLENENIELVEGAFFFPGGGPLAGRDFPGRIVH